MNFDPKLRRLIFALALLELAIIGTMITAVSWRHGRSEAMAESARGETAPSPVRQAVPVDAKPHVVIDAGDFAIDVVAGGDGKVSVEDLSVHTGVIGRSRRTVELAQTEDGAKLSATESSSISLGLSEHRLRVTVPAATELEITACSSASVSNLRGSVHVSAGNGRIELQNLASSVVEVEAGNGRVVATGVKAESFTVHASNGRIIAQRVSVAGAEPKLEFTASNGKIEFDGRLAASGAYSMESSNGSVRLGLTADSDTTVTASASNGVIRAGAGVALADDGDNKIAKFGEGRGALSVSSSNGSITISQTDGV